MHVAAVSPLSAGVVHVRPQPTRVFSRLRTVVAQSRRHGLWIVAWSLVGWIGTGLAPALLDSPFLLMMLSPRAIFVALASDSVSLVPFVLFGTMRLGVTDASYYIVGKRFPRSLDRSNVAASSSTWKRLLQTVGRKGNQLCSWFCARPRLAGAFLFFRPNGKYLALAGAYGVPAWTAALSSAAGTATFLAAVHIGLGSLF